MQPFSIFLPWRNPWNNFQVSGNPCIKIIISTAHGTLAWWVSCRYNNPIIIVNALLSTGWYFSVNLFILANKFKKLCLFFSITISRGIPGFRGTPVEKTCCNVFTLGVCFFDIPQASRDIYFVLHRMQFGRPYCLCKADWRAVENFENHRAFASKES
jgi:hypothetical protein